MDFYKLTKIFFYVAPTFLVVLGMMVRAGKNHWGWAHFFIVTIPLCCFVIFCVKCYYFIAPKVIDSLAKANKERVKRQLLKSGELVEPKAQGKEEESPQVDTINSGQEKLAILAQSVSGHHSIYSKEEKRKERIAWARVQKYITQELLPYGFSEDEITRIILCFDSLVHSKHVCKDFEEIKKVGKQSLNQQDFSFLTRNITDLYDIDDDLVASFIKTTFANWFPETSESTIKRKKNSYHHVEHIERLSNLDHIEIDEADIESPSEDSAT